MGEDNIELWIPHACTHMRLHTRMHLCTHEHAHNTVKGLGLLRTDNSAIRPADSPQLGERASSRAVLHSFDS